MITASLHLLRAKTHCVARTLANDRSGLALIEFALAAPLVLGMGMLGTETATLVIAHLQMSQIAMQVADNASRVGEANVLTNKRVYERDIAETLIGAEKVGDDMDLFERGRVIISSLQLNAQNGQWIAWQRCRGAKQFNSSYGIEGDGETGRRFPGMGEPGRLITASAGTAVIFVEVSYTYKSLTPFNMFEGEDITYTAAFNVRDSRDLTQLYEGGPEARCNVYSAARPT